MARSEPSVKRDRQEKEIQKQEGSVHPRQIKHALQPQCHIMKNTKAANRAKKGNTKGGKEEKLSEDIRPRLSLHKFPFLF